MDFSSGAQQLPVGGYYCIIIAAVIVLGVEGINSVVWFVVPL